MAVAVMEERMRLDQCLAEMCQGSRSRVKELARQGRIRLNGQVVKKADVKINPSLDRITLDGTLLVRRWERFRRRR